MTIFLKQYGAQRTGTNYLRILLQKNYPDVCMLMHVLGDKHSPPAPLDDLWAAAQGEPDPAMHFVSTATFQHPSLSTSKANPKQQAELRRVAEPLAEAFANGRLGYVVTIKNPYAWAVSVAMYEGMIGRGTATLGPRLVAFVQTQCESFNKRYREWLELTNRHPSRAMVVRHEDLVGDPERVLGRLDEKFSIRREGPFVDETNETPMTWWDNTIETAAANPRFDRAYYLEERFRSRLSAEAQSTVTETIDWELMRAFDYEPV